MKIYWVILSLMCASLVQAADEADRSPNPAAVKPDVAQIAKDTNDPASVVKQLFIAMASNDEATIRKIILPNSNASVLWRGQKAPDEAIAMMKKDLENSKCRELKVGEIFKLPGNKELKITDKMVNKDNKMLVPTLGGMETPTPFPVKRVQGQWKVDAGALIAGRLAAQKAMEKGEAGKK
jgi:hypothetical protein